MTIFTLCLPPRSSSIPLLYLQSSAFSLISTLPLSQNPSFSSYKDPNARLRFHSNAVTPYSKDIYLASLLSISIVSHWLSIILLLINNLCFLLHCAVKLSHVIKSYSCSYTRIIIYISPQHRSIQHILLFQERNNNKCSDFNLPLLYHKPQLKSCEGETHLTSVTQTMTQLWLQHKQSHPKKVKKSIPSPRGLGAGRSAAAGWRKPL